MHEEVRPGAQLKIGKPRNNFPLDERFDEYLLIAGGIGVTPLLAMAHRLHQKPGSVRESQARRCHLSVWWHRRKNSYLQPRRKDRARVRYQQFSDSLLSFSLSVFPTCRELQQHSGAVTCLAFVGSTHLLSGSADSTICIWRVHDWTCLQILGTLWAKF